MNEIGQSAAKSLTNAAIVVLMGKVQRLFRKEVHCKCSGSTKHFVINKQFGKKKA